MGQRGANDTVLTFRGFVAETCESAGGSKRVVSGLHACSTVGSVESFVSYARRNRSNSLLMAVSWLLVWLILQRVFPQSFRAHQHNTIDAVQSEDDTRCTCPIHLVAMMSDPRYMPPTPFRMLCFLFISTPCFVFETRVEAHSAKWAYDGIADKHP